LIEMCLTGVPGFDFEKMYKHVLVHNDAHRLRRVTGKGSDRDNATVASARRMWPTLADYHENQLDPAGSLTLPSHIDMVEPADLQAKVASVIRKNMTAVTLDFLRLLCRAYGYNNVSRSGYTALCWQLGNKRARKNTPLSGPNFVSELVKHPMTGPFVLNAVTSQKQSANKIKHAFFRKHMPKTREEVMMMANTNTTYR
jgi:hypothetical protein